MPEKYPDNPVPNTELIDGRMSIYPKAIQEVDENIRRINAESKLHNPNSTAESTPNTEEITSKLAPILEMIADAYKEAYKQD